MIRAATLILAIGCGQLLLAEDNPPATLDRDAIAQRLMEHTDKLIERIETLEKRLTAIEESLKPIEALPPDGHAQQPSNSRAMPSSAIPSQPSGPSMPPVNSHDLFRPTPQPANPFDRSPSNRQPTSPQADPSYSRFDATQSGSHGARTASGISNTAPAPPLTRKNWQVLQINGNAYYMVPVGELNNQNAVHGNSFDNFKPN